MAEYTDPFNPSLRGVNDQGSVSEDDYLLYQDSSRMDADLDGQLSFLFHFPCISLNYLSDEPNSSLTSQTLNADGTPKRPMNAFMIFARRRRPQVSAEHQSMRTGDVSKILSREWNAMDSVTLFPAHCPIWF